MRADLLGGTWGHDDDATGGRRWRDCQRALYHYMRRDMRDAEDQLQKRFTRNWQKIPQRQIPLVWRIVREQSTLYQYEPERTFTLGNAPIGGAALSRIRAIYDGARVNRKLAEANDHLVALNNATVWVWPVMPRREFPGGVRLLVPAPHEQEVQVDDLTSHSERDVACWWLRLPVQTDATTGVVTYAIAKVTRDEAIWEDGPAELKGRGIWMADGSNPLGQVPVVMLRGSTPAPCEWFAPANEDLLTAQRNVNLTLSDLGHIATMQSHGQLVLTGFTQTDGLELGPETALATQNPDANASFIQAGPDLGGYREQMVEHLRQVVAHNGLNPSSFLKAPGITALATRLEIIGRAAERKRHEDEFRLGEKRLYSLIRAWTNVLRGQEVLPVADVQVEYREATLPADPLAAAQALELEFAMGLSSRVRERARRDGVGLDEARARVRADLAEEATVTTADVDAAGEVGVATQDQILNGAQITAVLDVAERVGSGSLTAEGGASLLAAGLGLDIGVARRILAGSAPSPDALVKLRAVGE